MAIRRPAAGQVAEQAKGVLAKRSRTCVSTRALGAAQTFSSGKGDVLLGYEKRRSSPETGRGSRYVSPTRHFEREPARVVTRSKDPKMAQSSRLHVRKRAGDLRARAIAGSWRALLWRPSTDPAKLFEIGKFGAGKVNDGFDPERHRGRIFQYQGKSTASTVQQQRRGPAPTAAPVSRGPRMSLVRGTFGPRRSVAYLSISR